MLILLIEGNCEYGVEKLSCGMTYILSFINFDEGCSNKIKG
jgi:hypothetical protein